MRYAVELDIRGDRARPWAVRDAADGHRTVDRFVDPKAAELFAKKMDSLRGEHADPAGAGWRDEERTDRATGAVRVNGELMERAAAIQRTAKALGVCPVELARSLHAATAANRTAVRA